MAKRTIRLTGEYYTHQALWRTAKHFLKEGEQPAGSFYPLLAAGVFAFFAFESLLNEILRQAAPDVWKDERALFSKGEYCGTLGKYDYLAKRFGVLVDKSRRPYQSVKELADARDWLAHAKTEPFDVLVKVKSLDLVPRHPSVLDKYSSIEFIGRAITDIGELSDALVVAVTNKMGDMGIGGADGAYSGVDGSWQASEDADQHPAPDV